MNPKTITADDLEAAEHVLGVAYSPAERELMLGNIDGQINAAIARRRWRPGNALPPATRFDPRLPGFAMPAFAPPPVFSRSPASLPARY